MIEAGKNYGWDVMEGTHCYEPEEDCETSGLAMPVWEYSHDDGRSITGGYVYRGGRVPELVGKYVYADYVSELVWALSYDEAAGSATNEELLDAGFSISSFGVDEAGELYALDYRRSDGKLYRFSVVEVEEAP